MNPGIVVIIAIITLIIGVAIGYGLYFYLSKQVKSRLQIKAENILLEAEEKAKEAELQAKDKAIQIRQQADADASVPKSAGKKTVSPNAGRRWITALTGWKNVRQP
jgi:beta-lactamase regulating signal transducer with metallopeptidase domain